MPHRTNVVLTGATNGIGRVAASALAGKNTRLIVLARDKNKAEALRLALMNERSGVAVDVYDADFARLETVAAAGRLIAEACTRIDVLINNAGIHAFEQRVTEDGFAEMVAVNYLAPWLLTAILRDRIVGSAPARIVTVASEVSRRYTDGVDPDHDLRATEPFNRLSSSLVYGRTKLMNIMFSMELARQLSDTAVAVNCLNPGFNVTGLGRELPFAALLERILRFLRIGSPQRGADLIVRLATDPAFGSVSGLYVSVPNGEPLVPNAQGADPDARLRLWSATAELLRPYLHKPNTALVPSHAKAERGGGAVAAIANKQRC